MKKTLFILFLISCVCYSSFARHIAGGEIFYEYQGPGAIPGTSNYKITLRLFRDCLSGGAQLDGAINIGIFDRTSNSPTSGSPFTVNLDHMETIQKSGSIPCIINAPVVCYQVGYYYLNVTLTDNAFGYWVSFQRCCRVDNISNLSLAIGAGATYLGSIAGTNLLGTGHNSSPQFYLRDTALICQNRKFTLDFSASDADGDSLSYEFCEAFDGGSSTSPVVPNPPPPPYSIVPYGGNFSSSSPLGSGVSINPSNGRISGIAPAAGSYVITVCVTEWRNGVAINYHRKDFILQIGDCDFVAAQLPLSATFCDDFVTTFENLTPSSLIFSWHWDFGVKGITNDTSNLEKPIFTYADTGIYNVKLVVNIDDPCTDSATMKLGVYPGFFPEFISTGVCINKPTNFNDQTTSKFGTVNSWKWDFGETTANNDTSRSKNPVYTFPVTGVKKIQLITGNTKGCVDTINKDISIIEKPIINFPFKDTLICKGDSLNIPTTGTGLFSWTPNSNILFANTTNPLVFPIATTRYNVQLDDNGCINKDSVLVRVVDNVSLKIRTDTSFCKGDGVQLSAVSNALQFSWTPNINLSDPAIINPIANPATNTTYQLKATIGSCSVIDDVTVFAVPYPFADAGTDEIICFKNPVQLNGKVTASSFYWKPQSFINNPFVLNPIVNPDKTTKYILIANDTLGCPKSGFDTVLVTVLPKVKAFAGNDTSIVAGQPLHLNASGGENYSWTPPTGLSNTTIANPVVRLTGNPDSLRYKVYVTDLKGCLDSATMLVKVYKTNPQIFVPTAFTPNGDGLNDKLKPTAVGIDKIEHFRIFNRWGQLVFSTTQNGNGWDGKIGNNMQPTGIYVWIVKGVDFTGKPVLEKGTTTLIR